MANPSADAVERPDVRARADGGRLRALALASAPGPASEPLAFLSHLVALQQAMADGHARAVLQPDAPFADAIDADAVADALPSFLAELMRIAPPPAAAAAGRLLDAGLAEWGRLVHAFWRGDRGGDLQRSFILEALLQPFAEIACASVDVSARHASRERLDRCPVCGDEPVVAILRDAAHGARRSLACGLCLAEWPAPRLVCAACGEEAFAKLAVHRADEYPAARVDTCETCRTYVKTIDMTRDATSVPIVDDIATVALDLWAREQGYRRLRPNLLRL